jgi:hypothetical protein
LLSAHVVQANHLFIDDRASVHASAVQFGEPAVRAAHVSGVSFKSLSTIGHTLAAFNELGLRWRVTPTDRYSDWYFLTGALEAGLVIGSTDRFTALNIPGSFRRSWSIERRLAEIEQWADRVHDDWDGIVHRATSDEVAHLVAQRLWMEARERELHHGLLDAERLIESLRGQLGQAQDQIVDERRKLAALESRFHEKDEVLAEPGHEIAERDQRLNELLADQLSLRAEHTALVALHEQVMATKAMRVQQRIADSALVRRLLGGHS